MEVDDETGKVPGPRPLRARRSSRRPGNVQVSVSSIYFFLQCSNEASARRFIDLMHGQISYRLVKRVDPLRLCGLVEVFPSG